MKGTTRLNLPLVVGMCGRVKSRAIICQDLIMIAPLPLRSSASPIPSCPLLSLLVPLSLSLPCLPPMYVGYIRRTSPSFVLSHSLHHLYTVFVSFNSPLQPCLNKAAPKRTGRLPPSLSPSPSLSIYLYVCVSHLSPFLHLSYTRPLDPHSNLPRHIGKAYCLEHYKTLGEYEYGLDAEIQRKLRLKYDPAKEQQAQAWIEAVIGEKFPGNFQESLKNGVRLCK